MRVLSRLLSLPVALTLITGLALLDVPGVGAVTISKNAKDAFIATLVPAAQQAQRSYGVPASVSIAQAVVDSDWGTSDTVKKAKNYFGIECAPKAKMTPAQFASLAEAQVGKPYVLGAEAAISNPDPPKFDCSELVEWLYGRSGNKITDLAAAQYNATKKVSGSPKVGDLVFLRNNPARSNGIGHVAVLTKKLDNGDWRIIEARGRAYGVVRTTLSYWKTRKYYAGLRRQSSFSLAGKTVTTSAAAAFQTSCVTIGKVSYAKYGSIKDSFAAHAAAVAEDSAYASVRKATGNISDYVTAIAKVEHASDAAAYAAKLNAVIDDQGLRDYDSVAFDLVLISGKSGAKVTALQYLLGAAGYTVATTGKYDSATVAAVKKFQKAKGLTVDGEAGPITLTALAPALSSGAKSDAVRALAVLLVAAGQQADVTPSFTAATTDAVKAFQSAAGRTVTGKIDSRTWAALFMTLDAATPKVSGKAVVGQKLTASAGNWGPGSVGLAYQWYRGDAPVSGSTATTHTVTDADAGQALSVRVTGTKQLYTTTVRTSSATATVPMLKLSTTPTPTVSGTAKIGATLTAKAGTWAPSPVTLAYQWYRGNARIASATKATYTVTDTDAGAALSVSVTATKTGHTAVTKKSAATAAVPQGLAGATPTISGTAKVGATLTAKPGTWTPAKVALSYQWYRNGTAVKGATKSTYAVAAADLDGKLTVRVTGTLTGHDPVSRTSSASAKVAKGTLSTKTPKITGTRKSGHWITVDAGNWGPGAVPLTYQWYRGSTLVKGGTKTRYKLTSKDKGKKVSVVVRGTKAGYATAEKKAGVSVAK